MVTSETNLKLVRYDDAEQIPVACLDETAAVELVELARWGTDPRCAKCRDSDVYKMTDRVTGGRSERFLWRCRSCGQQYTVRSVSTFEDSSVPLHKWCRAYWELSERTPRISALELSRRVGVSYKTVLSMKQRIGMELNEDFVIPLEQVLRESNHRHDTVDKTIAIERDGFLEIPIYFHDQPEGLLVFPKSIQNENREHLEMKLLVASHYLHQVRQLTERPTVNPWMIIEPGYLLDIFTNKWVRQHLNISPPEGGDKERTAHAQPCFHPDQRGRLDAVGVRAGGQ